MRFGSVVSRLACFQKGTVGTPPSVRFVRFQNVVKVNRMSTCSAFYVGYHVGLMF